ncbi:MAG: AraC family transcriptional regulator [Lachnospiraceae bacterium]|nr:AraC family transcriptional regulator [Lachnospiraceae bacterium]
MASKNICKFVTSATYDRIEICNFIYETNPESMTQKRVSPEHRMFLVVQGSGTLSINDNRFPLSSGHLFFIFQGETYVVDSPDSLEYMYISFTGTRSDELFRRFGISSSFRFFYGFDGLIPMWKTSLFRTLEMNVDLAAESVLLHSFSKFTMLDAADISIIQQIISQTEDDFTDPDLSLTVIAQDLGYNPKYLSHLFKDKYGISYSEYLRNKRLEYAISLFDHGIDSVKNVALLSGFRDPLYFSSVFKKSIGMSPTDYKAKTNGTS